MKIQPITVLVTSCGRFDLLQKTIDSFLKLSKYPIERIIIHEDSGDERIRKFYLNDLNNLVAYSPILLESKKIGQAKALDYLLRECETEYYFSTEDDWEYLGNPNFIEDSLKVMTAEPSVNHVWIRDPLDHKHPLLKMEKINGVYVREVSKNYIHTWGGFSHNPGLKRKSDWLKMFPNGFAEFKDELACNNHVVKNHNYKAVSLNNWAVRHIGWGRHTPGFVA